MGKVVAWATCWRSLRSLHSETVSTFHQDQSDQHESLIEHNLQQRATIILAYFCLERLSVCINVARPASEGKIIRSVPSEE